MRNKEKGQKKDKAKQAEGKAHKKTAAYLRKGPKRKSRRMP
ncbi:MAG: hypothetical protein ABIG98_08805 [Chloroflexota bacterium]